MNDYLLADSFFFAAHDHVSGRCKLNSRDVGLGIAGAMLAELVLFRKIDVCRAAVVVIDRAPPSDAQAHAVLAELVREGTPRPVKDWLRYLARNAYELVAQRLVLAGHVRATRRLLRSSTYRPVDPNAAAWLATRLATTLDRREPPLIFDVVLAGLFRATGLDRDLRSALGVDIGPHLNRLLADLPPPLLAVVVETEAAVGEAVMHHR